jgi:hypothetical protein
MSQTMKIDAIRETFPDEWVAAEVTKVDKADVPVAGTVLTHSPDKSTVYQTGKAHRAQHPSTRVFLFFTGDPIPEGVEVALAFLSPDQGTFGPWWGTASSSQDTGI